MISVRSSNFLSTPAAYGRSTLPIERIDTHISVVWLAGERAYKLKRAVHFDYANFSTLDLRRAACEGEVRLNRRTAPSLYLGVRPVTRESDGRLALGGAGTPVEWLVEMVRFDQNTLFDRLAERQQLMLDSWRVWPMRSSGCMRERHRAMSMVDVQGWLGSLTVTPRASRSRRDDS